MINPQFVQAFSAIRQARPNKIRLPVSMPGVSPQVSPPAPPPPAYSMGAFDNPDSEIGTLQAILSAQQGRSADLARQSMSVADPEPAQVKWQQPIAAALGALVMRAVGGDAAGASFGQSAIETVQRGIDQANQRAAANVERERRRLMGEAGLADRQAALTGRRLDQALGQRSESAQREWQRQMVELQQRGAQDLESLKSENRIARSLIDAMASSRTPFTPEQRSLIAGALLNPEAAAALRMRGYADQLQDIAVEGGRLGNELTRERIEDIRETRPARIRKLEAEGNWREMRVEVERAEAELKRWRSKLLEQEVDWYPKRMAVEIQAKSAAAQRALAQANSAISAASGQIFGAKPPTGTAMLNALAKAQEADSEADAYLAQLSAEAAFLEQRRKALVSNPAALGAVLPQREIADIDERIAANRALQAFYKSKRGALARASAQIQHILSQSRGRGEVPPANPFSSPGMGVWLPGGRWLPVPDGPIGGGRR